MKTAARSDATVALDSRPSRPGWFAPMNARQRDWKGRTVWLVGASSGIGRATASLLHRAGARVIVSARNEASLREFAEQHPGALTFAMDVSDPQAVSRTAGDILAVAPLDTVLYCAGYYTEQRATRFNMAEMLRHQEVNYLGALHVLDGGQLLPSPPSTVVDCTGARPRVIRPGAVSAATLRAVVPDIIADT